VEINVACKTSQEEASKFDKELTRLQNAGRRNSAVYKIKYN